MNTNHEPISIFWFRRDLRINDNAGFYQALKEKHKVLPLFIFDNDILEELPRDDARVSFIHKCLTKLNSEFHRHGSSLLIEKGKPLKIWNKLLNEYNIKAVYANADYEPYGINRDLDLKNLLQSKGITFKSYKDHVIMESHEVLKKDGKPYTIYTPYSKIWLQQLTDKHLQTYPSQSHLKNLVSIGKIPMLTLRNLGFEKSKIEVPDYDLSPKLIGNYENKRNNPSADATSYLGVHLRFGTLSIRQAIREAGLNHTIFIKELIWREFFMQIIANFPYVVTGSFKKQYDNIKWQNNAYYFDKWCKGETGYPIVDAGMRQLNETGFMHNRVRMVTASFLCKHLLVDWRWGEAYFADKLLDYELSSNNGNWQWAAGCGCDAAPYFRVFNPTTQQQKFDPDFAYIKKWVDEYETEKYPNAIIDHKEARIKVLGMYKEALDFK